MHGAIRRAEELLAEHPDWYMPQQFSNPANPEAHRRTTGPEILEQLPSVDAFVAGVGTGGTITGVGEVLRARAPGGLDRRGRARRRRRCCPAASPASTASRASAPASCPRTSTPASTTR